MEARHEAPAECTSFRRILRGYPRTEGMVETAKKAEQGAKHRSEGLAVKTTS